MELVDEHTHRVLAYIAAVTRQGYALSEDEVEAYARSPQRQDAIMGSAFSDWFAALAVFEPVVRKPPEGWVDYLTRLRWIELDHGKVGLTRLGHALLLDLNSPNLGADRESTIEVVLDPKDPFAYSRVLTSLADIGAALLVDPYFRVEQLFDIVGQTRIDRVLLSNKIGQAEINKLAYALTAVPDERPMELRMATELHDRFVIPAAGQVAFIGSSLGGVGKSVSTFGTLSAVSSDAIRAAHERLWDGAQRIDPDKREPASGDTQDG